MCTPLSSALRMLLCVGAVSGVLTGGQPLAQRSPVSSAPRSALVLGWFHASERELGYVAKLYARNGFTDVVVRPSVIGKIAKPRGWYRSIRRGLRAEAVATHATTSAIVGRDMPSEESNVSRHFDVVHCLSGGFLSLYVLLRLSLIHI